MSDFDHVWYWRARLPDRKGQRCRVVARGRMNSILVEFADGYRVVTCRYAVRCPLRRESSRTCTCDRGTRIHDWMQRQDEARATLDAALDATKTEGGANQ